MSYTIPIPYRAPSQINVPMTIPIPVVDRDGNGVDLTQRTLAGTIKAPDGTIAPPDTLEPDAADNTIAMMVFVPGQVGAYVAQLYIDGEIVGRYSVEVQVP